MPNRQITTNENSVSYLATEYLIADSARGFIDFAPDLIPSDGSTTATITVGSSVDVSIDTVTDHDWYRVTLTAGTTYTIHTTAISGGGNPDSLISLRDANGALLIEDDDGGASTFSLIRYTPTTSGVFFIDAGTYNVGGQSSSGSYHLSVAAVVPAGVDAIAATTATTGTITINGSIDGNVDTANDHDWYAITLVAGQSYIFRTGGVGGATNLDTTLTLRDAAGTQLAFNDDGAADASATPAEAFSALRFTAATSGTYYLDVGAFGAGTGAFNLTAFTTPPLAVFSNNEISTQLTNGYWGGTSHHFNVTPGGTITFNVAAISAAGQNLAREAFNLWADVTGIVFTEVTTGGNITFANTAAGAFANAIYANGITTSATVNISLQWLTDYGTGLNSYSFQTYIHEIGHTLGLGHGGNYNGSAGYAVDALYANDSWSTTIMSYFDQNENSYTAAQGFTRQFAVSPMVADNIATTALYGTATTTRTGDTTYGFNNTSGRAIYDAVANPSVGYTIYDNGGIDTLDYSGFTQNQRIDLNPEAFSNIGSRVGNVSIARGAVIENAIGGTGNDVLVGNSAANTLTGGGGNDTLIGGLGADTLIGGAGFNTVSYEDNFGAVFVNLTTGVGSGNAAAGDTYSGIQGVIGSSGADTIIGDANGNQLDGGGGDDVLIGALGSDILIGGGGTDTASYGDNQGAVFVNLASGQGFGNAAQGDTYTSIENLTGSIFNDVFIGDSLANRLDGGLGDDILIGGLGADALVGGLGTDTASYEDNQGAVFVNLATGQGFGNAAEGDTYSGIENVTGSVFFDYFIGDAQANVFDGGRGNDTFTGGAGADVFAFTSALNGVINVDTITDFTSGVDRIRLSSGIFAAAGPVGALSAAAFVSGTAATNAAQHIIYNAATGDIFYDADGNGAGAAVLFAHVNPGTTVTAGDFIIA
jgi:serralysin